LKKTIYKIFNSQNKNQLPRPQRNEFASFDPLIRYMPGHVAACPEGLMIIYIKHLAHCLVWSRYARVVAMIIRKVPTFRC
jgi:hypothetical protein